MVAHVVEGACEAVHVVAVERRDEGAVHEVDDLVRDAVTFVLAILHPLREFLAAVRERVQQFDHLTGDRDRVLGGVVVELEELALLGDEADACHCPRCLHGFAVRRGRYLEVQMGLDTPAFQVFRGSEPPRFASQAELECAKLLDYYGVPWEYEPRTFVLEEDEGGRVLEAFSPDFYLPDQDLYVELTVMKQSLVTRKNRKLRKMRARYPDVKVKLFYKRDLERLAQHFHLDLAS